LVRRGRFDVDDAGWSVGVERRVDVVLVVDPDVRGNDHREALVVDAQQRVDVELLAVAGGQAELLDAPGETGVLRCPWRLVAANSWPRNNKPLLRWSGLPAAGKRNKCDRRE
jgi:hypothetical protein